MNFLFSDRNIFSKNEILQDSLSILTETGFSKKIIKEKIILKNFKNLSINQNKCFITNHKYSVIKRYRLSRITFRAYINKGYLSGLRRSMW
jgi:ribosomal protein S14